MRVVAFPGFGDLFEGFREFGFLDSRMFRVQGCGVLRECRV